MLGLPDVGLTTMTERADQVAWIVSAVGVPVVADIDTGVGNAIHARRAVAEFERAVAAAIQIETRSFRRAAATSTARRLWP